MDACKLQHPSCSCVAGSTQLLTLLPNFREMVLAWLSQTGLEKMTEICLLLQERWCRIPDQSGSYHHLF